MFLGPFAAYHYYFFRRQNYGKILLAQDGTLNSKFVRADN